MVDSLRLAVEEAGGMFFGIDYLERTTVLEFIAHLATNHIRFIFVKPEDKE